jgi:enamine deaminase RidA (YjgF/YER057c/UK114 family)
MMAEQSRRAFVGSLGAAAAVGIVAGRPGAATASEGGSTGKRVIGTGTVGPFSRAVALDRLVFVSGVIAVKPGTRELAAADFAGQARQVMKCQAFLTEQSDFAIFNEIYKGYFPSDPPARSTVIVKDLVLPGAKIEVDCFACTD